MSASQASRKRHASSVHDPKSSSNPTEHKRKRAKVDDTSSKSEADFRPNGFVSATPDVAKPKKISAHLTEAATNHSSNAVDESHATVIAPTTHSGNATSSKIIEISSDAGSDGESDEEVEDDDEDDEDNSDDGKLSNQGVNGNESHLQTTRSADKLQINGTVHEDNDSEEQDEAEQVEDIHIQPHADEMEQDGMEEPTFGELVQANGPEEIDIDASLDDSARDKLITLLPTGDSKAVTTSLTSVLSQALRTNDKELLENCFRTKDGDSVRATIERLPSNLVANLLQRIAQRLHYRPGRAGNLMIWVQWSIVAHGGYLASQPELVKQLSSLARVLRERAAGLPLFLALKGKMDMLNAQMELKRSREAAAQETEGNESDEEEAVIYVEGQDDSSEEEGDHDHISKSRQRSDHGRGATKKSKRADLDIIEGVDDDLGPMVNGVSDDEDEDSEDAEGVQDDDDEDLDLESDDELEDETSDDNEGHEEDEIDPSGSEDNAAPSKSTARRK
jgi:U3 small nucleolar RNA-associated protein 5